MNFLTKARHTILGLARYPYKKKKNGFQKASKRVGMNLVPPLPHLRFPGLAITWSSRPGKLYPLFHGWLPHDRIGPREPD